MIVMGCLCSLALTSEGLFTYYLREEQKREDKKVQFGKKFGQNVSYSDQKNMPELGNQLWLFSEIQIKWDIIQDITVTVIRRNVYRKEQ